MAPKNSRGKVRGEKKKKDEKVLPVVTDITVNLPDETHVVLKGISTDRIIDVQRLLSVNTEACFITNFSLSHEVRGPQLKETVDVSALKPCTLTLNEEDYDEELAVAHVRRLLDIVACTTYFGPSGSSQDKLKPDSGKNAPDKAAKKTASKPPATSDAASKQQSSSPKSSPKGVSVDEEGEMSHACPKLGSFYEFFSLSHLAPPLQFIRKATKRDIDEISGEDHLFSLDVKLCNGKLVLVEACKKGFYSVGKQRFLCHNLVDLLRQLSRAFDNAYEDLMKAFAERNKFGNLPYGFRANTWLIPPFVAQSPAVFPPLPVEDEAWGGNGGGLGRDGEKDMIPWADEFAFLASMPCKTAEERQVRDRKAFLLHSLFVDIAIFRAVKTVRDVRTKPELLFSTAKDGILYAEKVGDLNITVMKDASSASSKVDTKIDGVWASALDKKNLLERNLLKGITADENTAAHDIATLGVVNVRYCGYIVVVKVEEKKVTPPSQSIELEQPEGGANALNINSLRLLLHNPVPSEHSKQAPQLQALEREELCASEAFVERLLEKSLVKLEEEELEQHHFVRWELGACWIQHLQDQKNTEKDKKHSNQKDKKPPSETEMKVEGLGTPLRSLKNNRKKSDESMKIRSQSSKSPYDAVEEAEAMGSVESHLEVNAKDNEVALQSLLSNEAFSRLKESDTGLHCKSLQDLIDSSQKYYVEVALPKLVKLSEKLSHVQSLCIHEMIVRAFKHILQAVIAAVMDHEKMAATIAAALNLMLGVPESGDLSKSCHVHMLVWRWLEVFLKKRYEWDLSRSNFKDVRKFAILRGLCHKATIYQQKALDINERELGLDHPDTMKSYGDLAVFYYRLQHTELALKYVKRALYLLHLTCGPSHPNTAATYINVAMMEEGLGNVHIALRYLHKALKCNQRLLGPDHIQTAASYHAIAIALSLMEAYPLSVQHEQTTLQILRAKLGPDDLRTQDAAAWLEYFESKAFEQQEAARNGTKKPDASIASKGHLSVSDLLDYINPSRDSKGRDVVALKRKSYISKVKGKTQPNANISSSDESAKDASKEASDVEVHMPQDDSNLETRAVLDELQHPVVQEAEKKPSIDKETLPEAHTEGEDGWQSVQRPRSAGSYGRRLKQRRGIVGKVYTYQKKTADADMDYSSAKNIHHNSRYYLLKKRALSHGSYIDHHTTNPSQATKFGRRMVKAVTYRIKSTPSDKNAPSENSVSGGQFFTSSESGSISNQNGVGPIKNTMVSLGKSPSYKEVALAPPGTIAKVWFPQNDTPDNLEISSRKHEEETNGEKENAGTLVTGMEDGYGEKHKNSPSKPSDPSKKEIFIVDRKAESHSTEVAEHNLMPQSIHKLESGSIEVHENIENESLIDSISKSIDSPPTELSEHVSSTEFEAQANSDSIFEQLEDLKDKSLVLNSDDTRGLPNRKLSASAAPFNPSPLIARPAPVGMNMPLPSAPGAVPAVAPWQVNMTLHPGPTAVLPPVPPMSPHHPFPSPPPTPNMLQPFPFMYPPYSQPQAVPSSSFPVTSTAFHPNHFSWQCNVNPNIPEFIPTTIWRGCHAVEFSAPPPVVEPIPSSVLEAQMQFESSGSPSPPPILPSDIVSVGEANNEVNLPPGGTNNANELAGAGLETVTGNGDSRLGDTEASGKESNHNKNLIQNTANTGDQKNDGEKTFSILLRGRRNRKQTVRMPISLLSRPYGSQSFKVIYNRVIRGSEAPKSTSFSSGEGCTANAT
ncbi:hypothetical protein Tsubulata_012996 [Turnera subulata]|uniref:Clu domain-containing protein n=1 Tax=Turnera subulata TaxID=218843 RepID=A0A9Q0J510_9ROSI|nr:hypothetical protein Tsubulata_012996 [Turnera subulata]